MHRTRIAEIVVDHADPPARVRAALVEALGEAVDAAVVVTRRRRTTVTYDDVIDDAAVVRAVDRALREQGVTGTVTVADGWTVGATDRDLDDRDLDDGEVAEDLFDEDASDEDARGDRRGAAGPRAEAGSWDDRIWEAVDPGGTLRGWAPRGREQARASDRDHDHDPDRSGAARDPLTAVADRLLEALTSARAVDPVLEDLGRELLDRLARRLGDRRQPPRTA